MTKQDLVDGFAAALQPAARNKALPLLARLIDLVNFIPEADLSQYQPLYERNAPNGYAGLDANILLELAVLQRLIADGATAANTTWSSTRVTQAIDALKSEILGGVGPAYDTLLELYNEINANAGAVAAILTTLALKANTADVVLKASKALLDDVLAGTPDLWLDAETGRSILGETSPTIETFTANTYQVPLTDFGNPFFLLSVRGDASGPFSVNIPIEYRQSLKSSRIVVYIRKTIAADCAVTILMQAAAAGAYVGVNNQIRQVTGGLVLQGPANSFFKLEIECIGEGVFSTTNPETAFWATTRLERLDVFSGLFTLKPLQYLINSASQRATFRLTLPSKDNTFAWVVRQPAANSWTITALPISTSQSSLFSPTNFPQQNGQNVNAVLWIGYLGNELFCAVNYLTQLHIVYLYRVTAAALPFGNPVYGAPTLTLVSTVPILGNGGQTDFVPTDVVSNGYDRLTFFWMLSGTAIRFIAFFYDGAAFTTTSYTPLGGSTFDFTTNGYAVISSPVVGIQSFSVFAKESSSPNLIGSGSLTYAFAEPPIGQLLAFHDPTNDQLYVQDDMSTWILYPKGYGTNSVNIRTKVAGKALPRKGNIFMLKNWQKAFLTNDGELYQITE